MCNCVLEMDTSKKSAANIDETLKNLNEEVLQIAVGFDSALIIFPFMRFCQGENNP